MIQHSENHGVIEKSGIDTPAHSFSIQSSAHAFRVLSRGLYANPMLAIIRELSCNAYDSHVDANKKETAFEVHLPTHFEPFFSVKDFGIGLSPEGIRDLYCTYFSSSKSQSNASIGSFGLGSKSPFAYTDGFTVISIFDGVQSTYTACINDIGTPEVDLMDQTPAPEGASTGLEVKFPVEKSDITEFQNNAAIALEFMTPTPIVNIEYFTPRAHEYTLKTDTWGIRKVEHG